MIEHFNRCAVKHALKKPANDWISSTDKDLDVKAVLVSFSNDKQNEYRITEVNEKFYSALRIYEPSARYQCSIPFKLTNGTHLMIRHWYHDTEIRYGSALEYFWGTFSFFHLRHDLIMRFQKQKFIRSLKLRENRHDVLQALVDEHIRRGSKEVAPAFDQVRIDRLDVVSLLYTDNVWEHPKISEIITKLDLVIDSLIASGDLDQHQDQLTVKGKSIASIASHIEDDRRHNDQLSYNKWIRNLTLVIACATMAQALVAFSSSYFGD
ncbi:hypothetical protein [Pseudotabrizicola alkalilacus]|uniref:hypothetical protein n=1 Tax=Pseudotabrizicola alkalilacus TaxID=2305252 RepID=UPI0011C19023|nr:hypothetical protein [Pseudotabrizicola alkalilacus]